MSIEVNVPAIRRLMNEAEFREMMSKRLAYYLQDISTDERDVVIETLLTCMCENVMHDCGVTEPCSVLCALDQEAARRALPEMQIQQLRKKVDGAPLCVFSWVRKRSQPEDENVERNGD